jgi:site-specific DNA-methyltransferase (adenine-specific)
VREIPRQYEENSFHGCLTDPPYGLRPIGSRSTTGFNGETWDGDVPSTDIFRELRRICVPGGLLLSFGHPRTFHHCVTNIEQAGYEIHGNIIWTYNKGLVKAHKLERFDRDLMGYRSGVTPGHEMISVAMKSRIGTYAANFRRFGVAGLNVDGCRFETGQLPTDALLDEDVARVLGKRTYRQSRAIVLQNLEEPNSADWHFTATVECPKANRTERNAGVDARLAERHRTQAANDRGFLAKYGTTHQANNHPCVKPLALTTYLATSILPPAASWPRKLIVPYSGSASEIIGAMLAGWDEIVGIEQNPKFIEIARQRIEHWAQKAGKICTIQTSASGRQYLSTITPSRPLIPRRRIVRRPVLVTVDPADMAVLCDLGFHAMPASHESVEQIKSARPNEVAVVRRGTFGGHRVAERVAAALLAYVPTVKIVAPVVADDVHANWAGRLTAAELQQLIDATPALDLTITTSLS